MRPSGLKQMLDRRPFDPIRLHLSNGERVEIKHPELAFVTRSAIVVARNVRSGIADYVVHYNLLHIVKIEPLNGRRRAPSRKKTG